MTIDQWQGLGNTAIWVTLILLISGVSYVWLERDWPKGRLLSIL